MTKIAVLGVSAVLIALMLLREKPEYAAVTVLAAGLLIFAYILAQLSGVVNFLKELLARLPIEPSSFGLLLKMLGIAYLAEFASNICRDVGYASVAGQIEIFAKLSIVALSLPFLTYLVELVEGFL